MSYLAEREQERLGAPVRLEDSTILEAPATFGEIALWHRAMLCAGQTHVFLHATWSEFDAN